LNTAGEALTITGTYNDGEKSTDYTLTLKLVRVH
jgi:hypothetical protein